MISNLEIDELAYELRLDAESFKAWSQNLGHENCLTTFSSYGEIPPAPQAEIIRGLAAPSRPVDATPPEVLRWLETQVKRTRANG